MTDEIVYAKDFGPNVASVVDAVTAIWPLHTDFMRSSLAAHDAQNRPVLEKLAADIVQLCGADLGDDWLTFGPSINFMTGPLRTFVEYQAAFGEASIHSGQWGTELIW